MDHPSLRYLTGEADALDMEAARIEHGLAMGRPAREVAMECVHRAADRVGPLLSEEKATLSATLWEHDASHPALQHEAQARQRVRETCEALVEAAERGDDCGPLLERYAADLHRYAEIERKEIGPAANAAGDRVLREADYRQRNYGHHDPAISVDWARLT